MNRKNNSLADTKTVAHPVLFKPLTVHASLCHKLMVTPKAKNQQLGQTTKTWLKEEAVAQVLGLRNTVVTKHIAKGLACEGKSIDLYNKVMRTNYTKNYETREEHGFRGTPDLLTNDGIVEIKTSWDATTFPFFKDDLDMRIKKAGYHWQCRVYMMLFGISQAVVCYCLVDTPEGEMFLNKWDNLSLHRFDGKVAEQKRISVSEVIHRDAAIEQKMLDQYAVANNYYQSYLKEIYNK